MTRDQLLRSAETQRRILRRTDVKTILTQHPDADWQLYYCETDSPLLRGTIHLGFVDIDEADIRDEADFADSDSWCLVKTLIDHTYRGNLRVRLTLEGWQHYTADEKQMLFALGRLREIPQYSTYVALTCDAD